jgi:hypothetical protein
MKQLIIAMLVGCLVFGSTAVASAGPSTIIYLDGFTGKYNSTKYTDRTPPNADITSKWDVEHSGIILGLESQFNDKFKLTLEYGQMKSNDFGHTSTSNNTSTIYKEGKCDYTLSEVKGGYRVVDCNSLKLDIIVSALNIDMKIPDSTDGANVPHISGNMFGADLAWNFSDKASIQATIASSLLGAYVYQNNLTDDRYVNEYQLKFNYFLTDHWGLNLGYRDYQFAGKSSDSYADVDRKWSLSGTTLGIQCKF